MFNWPVFLCICLANASNLLGNSSFSKLQVADIQYCHPLKLLLKRDVPNSVSRTGFRYPDYSLIRGRNKHGYKKPIVV